MSLFLSYLLIPIVLLIVIVNVIFRVKIIKLYKQLKHTKIDIDQQMLFRRVDIEKRYHHHPKEEVEMLLRFTTALRNLVLFAAIGLGVIVIVFLYIYFNRS